MEKLQQEESKEIRCQEPQAMSNEIEVIEVKAGIKINKGKQSLNPYRTSTASTNIPKQIRNLRERNSRNSRAPAILDMPSFLYEEE